MKELLKRYNISPDPMLGQNFMTRAETIRKIVSLAGIRPGETVLEIGAGLGFLTEELTKKSHKVVAVEIDGKLASLLKRELARLKNVDVVKGNILRKIRGMDCDVIVSNLPYAISEALLRKLALCKFRRAVLVVPKGFAYRLVSGPDERGYSRLSIFARAFFDIKIETELSKDDFYPKPDTNSVVISMARKPENMVQKLFLWEAKKVKNVLLECFAKFNKMTKNQARESLKSLNLSNSIQEKKARDIDLKGMKTIIKSLEIAQKETRKNSF